MNWADYIILGIIGISALFGIRRGFIGEALSLLGWIVAFWLALTFMAALAAQLSPWIDAPSLRLVVSFVVLVVVTLLLTAMINHLVGRLVIKTGLSGTDRMLGIVFGVLRGVVIVAILVLLAGLTPIPEDPWWHESRFLVHFQALAVEIRNLLPPELVNHLIYE